MCGRMPRCTVMKDSPRSASGDQHSKHGDRRGDCSAASSSFHHHRGKRYPSRSGWQLVRRRIDIYSDSQFSACCPNPLP